MAPYEYRICAVPDRDSELCWDVTLYIRRYSDDPDQTGWKRVRQVAVKGEWLGDRPAAYWKAIVKALKV